MKRKEKTTKTILFLISKRADSINCIKLNKSIKMNKCNFNLEFVGILEKNNLSKKDIHKCKCLVK